MLATALPSAFTLEVVVRELVGTAAIGQQSSSSPAREPCLRPSRVQDRRAWIVGETNQPQNRCSEFINPSEGGNQENRLPPAISVLDEVTTAVGVYVAKLVTLEHDRSGTPGGDLSPDAGPSG